MNKSAVSNELPNCRWTFWSTERWKVGDIEGTPRFSWFLTRDDNLLVKLSDYCK